MKRSEKISKIVAIAIFTLLLSVWTLCVNAQRDTTLYNRVDKIENELAIYGKEQKIGNKITFVSIVTVVGGSIVGIQPLPLLIGTSICDLATLVVSSRANRRLGNYKNRKTTTIPPHSAHSPLKREWFEKELNYDWTKDKVKYKDGTGNW